MATLLGSLSTGRMNFHRINSSLFKVLREVKCLPASKDGCVIMLKRGMAGSTNPQKFLIRPATFTDKRHLIRVRNYLLLTGVPLAILVTFINVFIGPAQLAEIPEGYEPKHWEYYEMLMTLHNYLRPFYKKSPHILLLNHPITRFLARYLLPSPQQEYEKMAHFIDIHAQKKANREELMKVKRIMKKRSEGYYYTPAVAPQCNKNDED